jgi:hypothetical protein
MADKSEAWAKANAIPADEAWAEANASPAVTVKEHVRARPGFLKQLARSQAKNLPAYGATLGAALGAPALAAGQVGVPVGMAMGGAALGKAIEQSLSGPLGVEGPSGLPEAYAQQAGSAALYGAAEGIPGQVLAPALKAGGQAFARSQMARALAPSKALVKNFRTVVEDALRQGASVNRWFGKGGAEAADQVRRDATGKVVGLLRAATSRGETIDIGQVSAPVVQAVEKKLGRPLDTTEMIDLVKTVQDRSDELLLRSVMGVSQRSSKLMNPLAADELRKAAARQASASLKAEASGLPTTAIPDMDRLIAKGAGSAVKTLRGVRAARAIEKKAIGVSRAVFESEVKPYSAGIGVGVGPVKAGVTIPPGLASRLALASWALGNPMIAPLATNILRTGVAVGGATAPAQERSY